MRTRCFRSVPTKMPRYMVPKLVEVMESVAKDADRENRLPRFAHAGRNMT